LAEEAKFGVMFEFSAVRTSVVTPRREYDSSVFSTGEVLLMIERINTALEELCQSSAYSMKIGNLEDRLLQAQCTDTSRVKRVEFSTHLATLV
jgi:hypothetical protein